MWVGLIRDASALPVDAEGVQARIEVPVSLGEVWEWDREVGAVEALHGWQAGC